MGKASRTKQDPDRRARIAAQREAERRRQQLRRIYLAGGSIIAVVIVVVAFVLFQSSGGSGNPSGVSNGPTGAALASVVKDTTTVPAATLDKAGTGGGAVNSPPYTVKPAQTPLTSGGKPEMLYDGAEYCPYCAAERWAMVVALSRFGTFSGLATVHSGSHDVYANTSTWTFVHAKYTSKYLTFVPIEEFTNVYDASLTPVPYTKLQTPTSAQAAVIKKYAYPPFTPSNMAGSFPFIDFGNKYLISGASYSPQVLAGKNWAQIASALHNPNSPIAQAVNGTANYMTAAICKMTGDQPASACTSVVKSIESKL